MHEHKQTEEQQEHLKPHGIPFLQYGQSECKVSLRSVGSLPSKDHDSPLMREKLYVIVGNRAYCAEHFLYFSVVFCINYEVIQI